MLITLRQGLCAIAISLAFAGGATANDPFAELDQEVQQLSADHSEEFNLWYTEHIREFSEWQMAYLEQWDEQQQGTVEKWGDGKVPSQNIIVVYDAKKSARTVIDLEKGEITVNYKLPEANKEEADISPQQELVVINQLIEQNSQLIEDVGITEPLVVGTQQIEVKEIEPQPQVLDSIKQEIKAQTERQMNQLDIYVEQDSVISAQQKDVLVAQQKQVMMDNEAERLAKAEQHFNQSKVKFQRSSSRVVEYKAKIPSSAVSERAKNYLPYIYAETEKHQLSAPLVLAIMHTESHFNPKAKSHVPAYGLMQIVPTTAGHDVNKLYRGKDKPMKPKELYNPQINIETGTAYLDILQNRYLRGIKDPESATYSVIAAYNTGSGNIAKAFGEKRVSAAVRKINTMDAEQVYQHLIKHLPYKETRNYLIKVNKRMQSYQQQQTYSMI